MKYIIALALILTCSSLQAYPYGGYGYGGCYYRGGYGGYGCGSYGVAQTAVTLAGVAAIAGAIAPIFYPPTTVVAGPVYQPPVYVQPAPQVIYIQK